MQIGDNLFKRASNSAAAVIQLALSFFWWRRLTLVDSFGDLQAVDFSVADTVSHGHRGGNFTGHPNAAKNMIRRRHYFVAVASCARESQLGPLSSLTCTKRRTNRE